MKYSALTLLKFVLALLSLLMLVGAPFLPPITTSLHPSANTVPSLYGPADLVTWLDRSQHSWRCEYGPEFGDEHCGMVLSWENLEPIAACSRKVADHDGDGWDWENGRSCIVYRQVSTSSANSAFPTCTQPDADIDGDGWGWENGSTCKVSDGKSDNLVTTAEGSWPYCAESDSDPDGDGWGWENEQSCIVRGSSADPNLERPSVSSAQAPYCSDAATDPDGDGWGWENNRSCVVSGGAVDKHNSPSDTLPIGIDMTGYQALRFYIQYEGRAEFVRVYLRNFNPAYADQQLPDSTKFMSATLLTDNLKAGPATLSLSNFNVAQWWLRRVDKPRLYGATEFNNIVLLGFDYVEPGVHKMQLDKIELVGERISQVTVLYALCAFWVIFVAIIYSWRVIAVWLSRNSGTATPPTTEQATPRRNRTDLELAYHVIQHVTPVGLLLLEVDHLQSIKQHCGSSICESLNTELQDLITEQQSDSIEPVSLDEGKFAILLPGANLARLELVAESLRTEVAQRTFNKELKLSITVSVGFTLISEHDSFIQARQRAEWALFQAMKTRNTICGSPR